MDNVILTRVEMGVRSITGSSGCESNSVVRNADQRDFAGLMENNLLMTAASRVDLNIDQNWNDWTRNNENSEDGNFSVLRPNYDRKSHTHHKFHTKEFRRCTEINSWKVKSKIFQSRFSIFFVS